MLAHHACQVASFFPHRGGACLILYRARWADQPEGSSNEVVLLAKSTGKGQIDWHPAVIVPPKEIDDLMTQQLDGIEDFDETIECVILLLETDCL